MNKFFTRKWYKYVCKEMGYALPKTYYLCCVNEKNFFDKLITDDVEYDLDKIIIDKFKEYFNRKKKYVDSYLKLEKKLVFMRN